MAMMERVVVPPALAAGWWQLSQAVPMPRAKKGGGLGLFSGVCKLRAALASRRRGCDRPRVGSVKWVG